MCGRIVAAEGMTWADLNAILRGFLDTATKSRRDEDAPPAVRGYNVKPTQQVEIAYLDGDTMVSSTARWWFVPHWFRGDMKQWKATTFNARIEEAAEKPTFRVAWKSGRCLIPANGYYEWTGPKNNRLPSFIAPLTNEPAFFFAGLTSRMHDGRQTCAIATREADPGIAHIHSRMPVILRGNEIENWLRGAAPDDVVREHYGTGWNFRAYRVRKFGRDDDGPDLISPLEHDEEE